MHETTIKTCKIDNSLHCNVLLDVFFVWILLEINFRLFRGILKFYVSILDLLGFESGLFVPRMRLVKFQNDPKFCELISIKFKLYILQHPNNFSFIFIKIFKTKTSLDFDFSRHVVEFGFLSWYSTNFIMTVWKITWIVNATLRIN